jgi:hypothetical protein
VDLTRYSRELCPCVRGAHCQRHDSLLS